MVMGTWSLRVETPLGLASPHLFLRARWGENEEVVTTPATLQLTDAEEGCVVGLLFEAAQDAEAVRRGEGHTLAGLVMPLAAAHPQCGLLENTWAGLPTGAPPWPMSRQEAAAFFDTCVAVEAAADLRRPAVRLSVEPPAGSAAARRSPAASVGANLKLVDQQLAAVMEALHNPPVAVEADWVLAEARLAAIRADQAVGARRSQVIRRDPRDDAIFASSMANDARSRWAEPEPSIRIV